MVLALLDRRVFPDSLFVHLDLLASQIGHIHKVAFSLSKGELNLFADFLLVSLILPQFGLLASHGLVQLIQGVLVVFGAHVLEAMSCLDVLYKRVDAISRDCELPLVLEVLQRVNLVVGPQRDCGCPPDVHVLGKCFLGKIQRRRLLDQLQHGHSAAQRFAYFVKLLQRVHSELMLA